MSWREAPLYVEAFDLACWILDRVAAWQAKGERRQALPVDTTACRLVSGVALALTFPMDRCQHLKQVDETIVVLRVHLRLAQHLGVISTRCFATPITSIGPLISPCVVNDGAGMWPGSSFAGTPSWQGSTRS